MSNLLSSLLSLKVYIHPEYVINQYPYMKPMIDTDNIPPKYIKNIESLYNIHIELITDEHYRSVKQNHLETYYLTYKNNEYQPVFKDSIKQIKLTYPKSYIDSLISKNLLIVKELLVFKKDFDKAYLYSRNGYQEILLTESRFNSKTIYFNKLVIFYDTYKKCINETSDMQTNLKNLFNVIQQYVKEINDCLFINILNYSSITNCIQSIIQKIVYANMSIDFKPITFDEYDFIENVSKGGLRYAKPGVYQNVYAYDIRDAYFSILRKKRFFIPVKPPREEFISYNNLLRQTEERTLKYGVYNIKLISNGHCFFTFNKNNLYTHYDLYNAKLQGLIFEDPQCLIKCYTHAQQGKYISLIESYRIFKSYISNPLKIKEDLKDNKLIKTFFSGC